MMYSPIIRRIVRPPPANAKLPQNVVTASTVGIAVVNQDAIDSATQVAVPDPSEEPEYPWLYWHSHPLYFATTGLAPGLGQAVVRHSFDVKSMRKVGAREGLVMLVEYNNLLGVPPINFIAGETRVLVALP